MTSGSFVYRQFGDARADVERDRRKIAETILGLQSEVDQALREQAGLWKKFAAFHIEADVALPGSVEQALDQREAKVAEKKDAVSEHTRLIDVAKKQIGIFDGKIEKLSAEITDEETTIRARFMADERVKPVFAAFTALEQAKANMERSHAAAVAECGAKRGAFEADELFMYLRKRSFGTGKYHSLLPIVRLFDRRLANAFNFNQQSVEYDFLLARPGMIEDRIKAQKPEFEQARAALEELEHEFFDVMQEKHELLEDLRRQRQDALDQIDVHGRQLSEINQFLADAALAEDSDLKAIISKFAEQLERLGFKSLQDMAAKTQSAEDDAILKRIQTLEASVAERNREIDAEKENLGLYERKLSGLKRIENEIDSNNWNGSGHTFSGIDATDLANAFLRGSLNETMIIGQLDNAHREPPRPRDTGSSGDFGGGFGGGFSGGSSGGFGGSSGGFRTTGGFGGGSSGSGSSFKTTGGFGGD